MKGLMLAICVMGGLLLMGSSCPKSSTVDTGPGGPEVMQFEEEGNNNEVLVYYKIYDEKLGVWVYADIIDGEWQPDEVGVQQQAAGDGCYNKCIAKYPGTSPSCKNKFRNCMQSCVDAAVQF